MSDEQPKRTRNKAAIEAAYRAGYADGYTAGIDEVKRMRDEETRREAGIREGLTKLQQQPRVVRKRRTRAEKEWPSA